MMISDFHLYWQVMIMRRSSPNCAIAPSQAPTLNEMHITMLVAKRVSPRPDIRVTPKSHYPAQHEHHLGLLQPSTSFFSVGAFWEVASYVRLT